MKSLSVEIPTIPQDAILEQLNKVLSSQLFQGAERSTRLLRFLVEQTIAGQPGRLKEYTVGTEALGRSSAFDPRTDTIVRAEVSRLRTRLDKYYATEGLADSLVIALSKGSYVPRFQNRTATSGSVASVREKRPPLSKNIAWFAFGLAAACVFMIVVWGLWRALQPASIVSIAVLPFANVSTESSQEFFSDGMTDEIAQALVKVSALRIVARSSAYAFKNQNKQAREVGEALGATHLIEGSVRQIGSRVRITAQLIEAKNGLQLWSETYDRDLTDIFAIQEDIAQSIAASLRVPLGLAQGDTLVRDRTQDLESYDEYLRAKALVRGAGQQQIAGAIAFLERIVVRDPEFAPAWALLAQAYALVPPNSTELSAIPLEAAAVGVVQSSFDKAGKAAREAIRLDSQNALAFGVLARVQSHRGKWAEAEDLYKQALTLDSGEPDVLENYSQMLQGAGRLQESLSVGERLRTLEPFVPIYGIFTALYMQEVGQNAASVPILEALPASAVGGALRNAVLARAYAAEGHYAQAADTLLLISGSMLSRRSVEDAARLLRDAPAKANASAALPMFGYPLNFIYAYAGAVDRLLEANERVLDIDYNVGASGLWHPGFSALRKTDRFKTFARKAGLVDYWRERTWPDLCRPLGADDLVCD